MYPTDLTEKLFWTYFAYQYRLKSTAILGDCFLMASHYRNAGCGSNENVITASADPVQGESSPTQTNIPSHFNLLRLWNDESWCPVERPHGDGSTSHCASQSICDNVTHFLECYSQPIIIKVNVNKRVVLMFITFASKQVASKKKLK